MEKAQETAVCYRCGKQSDMTMFMKGHEYELCFDCFKELFSDEPDSETV